MRTIENGNDKVVCFDEKVWLQERQLMYFTHKSGPIQEHIVRLSVGQLSNVVARYALDSNNEVVIDVTDLIRSLETPQTLYLWCGHSTSSAIPLVIPYYIGGLINPESVIIPDHTPTELTIAPPRMIYKGGATIEVMLSNDAGDAIYFGEESIPMVEGELVAKTINADFIIQNRDEQSVIAAYSLRDKVCGHRYALVRWVSAFGTTKVFTWEIIESKVSVDDTISLVSITEDYNTIKGREDSFSLFLDNLSAYDYWYYSDIITSSKVEVSLDGGTTFRQVDVTTKNVTIPDGDAGKMNELNVSVNYRKYDAVAM